MKDPVKTLEDNVVRERPSVAKNCVVERQILDRPGEHPRVVRCAVQLRKMKISVHTNKV